MNSESWASYRAAMPPECFGEPDDEPPQTPKQVANAPPYAVSVVWMADVEFRDADTGDVLVMRAPCGREFGAESWRWKHVKAWKEAMERRHGKGSAWIEEHF